MYVRALTLSLRDSRREGILQAVDIRSQLQREGRASPSSFHPAIHREVGEKTHLLVSLPPVTVVFFSFSQEIF